MKSLTAATVNTSDDAVRLRMLEGLRDALKDTIIPDLGTSSGISAGHMALRLVNHLIGTHGGGMMLTGTDANDPDPALKAAWDKLNRGDAAALSDAGSLAPAMDAIVGSATPESRALLEQLAMVQKKALTQVDPEAARGVADMYLGGRTANTEARAAEKPRLTPERLTAYLRQRLPEQKAVNVVALTPLSGGMSKQTLRAVLDLGGMQKTIVLRKDLEVNPADKSVVDEFPILRSVWEAGGVPIAEPLWVEPGADWFGAPLMATGFVEGGNDTSTWIDDTAARSRFSDSLARALARLHSLPVPGSAERSTREHVAAEVERWHSDWTRWAVQPRPLMEAVFAWLKTHVPSSCGRPSIVHGDIGFHNLLTREGEVTAILDWEFCHIGDAAADLVYARPFVEAVLDWPGFLADYARHGGTPPDAEAERFYAVWRSARNAAGCGGALSKFMHYPHADMRLGVSGLTFLPRFELDALEQAIGS